MPKRWVSERAILVLPPKGDLNMPMSANSFMKTTLSSIWASFSAWPESARARRAAAAPRSAGAEGTLKSTVAGQCWPTPTMMGVLSGTWLIAAA